MRSPLRPVSPLAGVRLRPGVAGAVLGLPARELRDRRVGRPGSRVGAVSSSLGVSERQLLRRFRDAVGYGPKTLDRVLRFQRFLALGGPGPAGGSGEALAGLAASAGYADQAHLTRESETFKTPRRRARYNLCMVPAQMNVITLGARDFAGLRAFYTGLGWPLAFDSEGFAAFELSGALLSLFPLADLAADAGATANAPPEGLRGFTMAIVVEQRDEVDSAIAAVRAAGGRITKEPVDAELFEGRSAYFADPEDNYWEVVWLAPGSPVAQAVRRAAGAA